MKKRERTPSVSKARTRKFAEKFLIALGIAGGIIVVCFVLPSLGKISWRAELIVRQGKLRFWQQRVASYVEKQGRTPESLYELTQFDNQGASYFKVSVPQNVNQELEAKILEDPNLFFDEVEYAFGAHRAGWFVIELVPGLRYKHRLIIDNRGKISELRETKLP